MGVYNVGLVYARWRQLPHLPFRLLVWMAYRSYDRPQNGKPARHYYGGWEELAYAAGRTVPPPDDSDKAVSAKRRAAEKSVDRAMSDLVDAGAITMVCPSGPGRNAEYALNLDGRTVPTEWGAFDPPSPMERSPLSGHNTPHSVAKHSPLSGQTLPTQRGVQEEQEKQETAQDVPTSLRTEVALVGDPTPVDNTDSDAGDDQEPGAGQASPAGPARASGSPPVLDLGDCPVCGVMLDPGSVCGNRECDAYGRVAA